MKAQHVIYRAGNAAVLYTWDGQRYTPVTGYALPDGDPAPVVDYLRQAPSGVIAILLDVMEEEHTQDTIAQLGRSDQQAILARKLARTFPRTVFRTATVQGRLPGDTKTTQILLSGLTKSDHLNSLMGLLADAKLPVACVCSPALLSRPLIDKLRPANPADATMLVSRQLRGGLRMTFFRGRHLVGSRLMRRSVAAQPGDTVNLVRQLDESVRYFDAAFVPGVSTPVDVILFCETGIDRDFAMKQGLGHEGYRLHIPDPVMAAKKLGFRDALTPGNANLLFVELLRRYAPSGNFAPAPMRRYFQLHQARSYGRAACLALSVSAVVALTLNGIALMETTSHLQEVRHSTTELTQLLQADTSDHVDNGADPLEMRRAVTAWLELQQHDVDPQAVLSLVSTAVERRPQILLDGVQWSPGMPMAFDTDAGDDGQDEPEAGDPDAGGATASASEGVRISIQGRVEPFDGNYPLAFREVRAFMDALGRDPRVLSVTARKQPLDVDPRSTLTGEITPAANSDRATFTVDLLVRFADEPA